MSQHVHQGTVSPTHYISLGHDEEVWKVDHLQRLAYKMTHMYYNWPGTIRVPAPCQVSAPIHPRASAVSGEDTSSVFLHV